MVEHSSFVNSCCPARRGLPLIVSGSDDGTAKLWDMCQRGAIQTFPERFQITAVSFSDASYKICTGGIDNDVTAGGSDRMVYVWDTTSRHILYKLPGHTGSVNECVFHPNEPIIESCSSDKQIYLEGDGGNRAGMRSEVVEGETGERSGGDRDNDNSGRGGGRCRIKRENWILYL
ncbi:putative ion channel CASTOR-like isoform X1 [Capsicum annuum]|nr:putative ion channel CASTOR-like isoform X1 [Capsicum annuum]